MRRESNRIRWHLPTADRQQLLRSRASATESRVLADHSLATQLAFEDRVFATLMSVGIPVIDEAKTAKEYAIGLLQVAAEVEHALLVQYLYAAVSATNAAGQPGLPRKKLMRIAVEEMGHLATVQNLLLLVDGRDALHMQRDQLRKQSEQNPIPFVLQPVSRPSLAAYVAAEMPASVPAALQQKVDELVALASSTTTVALHRVGAIYAVLKWIFLPAAEAVAMMDLAALAPIPDNPHLTDADLTAPAEVARYEADFTEWHGLPGVILEKPRSTADAVQAIERISEQGEGLGGGIDTHFEFFMQMVHDFDAGTLKARQLATSPNLGGGFGGEDGETISHPYTTLWGEVFARQYGLLVLSIYHALRTPRDSAGDLRNGLVSLAMTVMRTIIEPLSDALGALPLRSNDSGPVGEPEHRAGPPYDLDPALLLPPASEAEIVARHLAELSRLKTAYAAIEQANEFVDYPEHANLLVDLRDHDRSREELMSAAQAGNA
jgi:ferritin-like protein